VINQSHSERAHAKLSASGSAKWLNCPGSVEAESHYEDTSGIDAQIGTMAHEIADLSLQHERDAEYYMDKTLADLGIKLSLVEPSHIITKEMTDYVQEYLDYVRSFETPDTELWTEMRVDYSHIVPEGFGTLDSSVLNYKERHLHIFDLKYGYNKVEAFENTQGQMYALGLLNEIGFLSAFDKITIHICQPRVDNFSSWTITLEELKLFEKYVEERAKLALGKNPPRVPGAKQCQWCKARFDCKARKGFTEERLNAEFDSMDEEVLDSKNLTLDEKAKILEYKDDIEKFLKDIELDAYNRLLRGEKFPGKKLIAGKGRRQWTDKAQEVLEEKLGEKVFKERELKGIGDIEKLVGKKELPKLDITETPKGKPKMVDMSHKSPALEIETIDDELNNI